MKKLFFLLYRLFLLLSIVYIGATIFLFIIIGPVETEIFGSKFSFTSLVNPIRISLGLYLISLIFRVLENHQPWASILKKLWQIIKTGRVSVDANLGVLTASNSRLGRWIEALSLVFAFWAIFFLCVFTLLMWQGFQTVMATFQRPYA